jgi:hypothetical protein
MREATNPEDMTGNSVYGTIAGGPGETRDRDTGEVVEMVLESGARTTGEWIAFQWRA